MSATALTADTLDLFVTAGLRYGVLTNRTRSAFTASSASALQVAPDDAGRLLLQQHLAAWVPTLGAPPQLSGELRCYRHVPIPHVDPVHVLKAVHTYEAVAAHGSGWSTSAACALITALLRAAVQALPGYTEAPTSWRRPPVRGGTPIGLARTWQPIRDGVAWMMPRELAAHWESAPPSCSSPSTHCPTCLETSPPGTGSTSSPTARAPPPRGQRSPSPPHC